MESRPFEGALVPSIVGPAIMAGLQSSSTVGASAATGGG